MKHLKSINEMTDNKEKILVKDFIESLRQSSCEWNDEFFEEYDEHPTGAISVYLTTDLAELPDDFPYKFVDEYSVKGDYKDEETRHAIYQRKSDGKFFDLAVHDAGQYGPETLSMDDYLEEVTPKTKRIWE